MLPADLQLAFCRFDGSPAALVVEMEGCVCFPGDRLQPLCAQHAINSEPLGRWEVVWEAAPGMADWILGRGSV